MAAFLRYSEVIMSFHLQEAGDLRKEIAGLLASRRIKIAMLDDDPTGIQTVHDCLLLTDWEEKSLRMAFEDEVPFFYILTNSRSMCAEDAVAANREIVGQLMKVNRIYRFQLIIVSRSDSTLRGHFPMETDAIKEVLSAMNMAPEFPVFLFRPFSRPAGIH